MSPSVSIKASPSRSVEVSSHELIVGVRVVLAPPPPEAVAQVEGEAAAPPIRRVIENRHSTDIEHHLSG